MSHRCVLLEAAGVADGAGASFVPGAVLIEYGPGVLPTVLAVGRPEEVRAHPAAASARAVSYWDEVLIPGLVNAHTHLDLTAIGPQPYDPTGGFVGWIDIVRAGRAGMTSEDVRQSVRRGIHLLYAGGVVAVGDIAGAGRPEPLEELRASGLLGVSYAEFFGIGKRQEQGIEGIDRAVFAERNSGVASGGVKLGLQPHAPYSAGTMVYHHAARHWHDGGVPLCTHVAETIAEHEFIANGSGPFRQLLERLGIWDEVVASEVGLGLSPVSHLAACLSGAPCLIAHVNDCSDHDLRVLHDAKFTVAYCPRASAYFGHPETLGPHRYREMMAAGIRVVLGTDSILNIPPDDAARLTPLDDARLLYRRDQLAGHTLLRMMTTDAAQALHLEPGLFRFGRRGGAIAGLAVVSVSDTDPRLPPADRIMAARGAIRLLDLGMMRSR